MKRIRTLFELVWLAFEAHLKFLLAIVLVAVCGVAFAQASADPSSSPLPGFDFAAWGKSVATYAGFLAAAVALVKGRVPNLAGWGVLLLSLVLGEVGAFLLFTAGLLTDPTYLQFSPPWVWLAFGFSAFVIASGGYALLLQGIIAIFKIRRSLTPQAAALPTAGRMIGNHLILPAGTPGAEPLIHNGVEIGAVVPITRSTPTDTTPR